MIWSFEKFHTFIWGADITVVTDHHALCWLTRKKNPAGRLARWALAVQNYMPKIVYKNGKLHSDADALSRNPVEHCKELSRNLVKELRNLQEKVPDWKLDFEQLKLGRKTHPRYCLLDDMYIQKPVVEGNGWKLCTPPEKKLEILQTCHDDTFRLFGNSGQSHTAFLLEIYDEGCHQISECMSFVSSEKTSSRKIQRSIGIDILGPFPESSR